jgi:SEC-C motif-containing protein
MSKVGRNDPCPCGSGKKHKKCCLKKDGGKPSTPVAAVKEANANAKLMAQKWMSALGVESAPSSGDEYKLYLDEFELADQNAVERVRSLGKPGENGVLFYQGKQWVGEAVLSDDGTMTLTTADLKMANTLTGKLARLDGVSHKSRKEDVLEAGESGGAAAAGAEMLAFKVNFFKAWPDEANERLEGATPRVAANDPRLKKELLKLLTELEKAEARLPKKDRYSFKGIRKQLGL